MMLERKCQTPVSIMLHLGSFMTSTGALCYNAVNLGIIVNCNCERSTISWEFLCYLDGLASVH